MKVSNHDAGPSTISPKPNMDCQQVETILRKIDKLDLLAKFRGSQDFVWDDTLIPYTLHQLPKDKLKYEKRFVEVQKEQLPKPSQEIQAILESASKSDPPRLRFDDISKHLEFDFGDNLGEGTYGTVFKAKLPLSHTGNVDARSICAVKQILKRRGTDIKSPLREFKKERDNLECSEKKKHRHLVSFHASFTDEEYFGFITSPVADSNLKKLLKKSNKNSVIPKKVSESLSKAFGCLLEAVRHLHDDLEMRHCDLKPSNILVCGRPGRTFSVRICDLGISHKWNCPQDESTDENQRGTQRYKAPEVLSEQNMTHNRKADIFSLGCIFLEMYTVIRGKTLDEMARVIRQDQIPSFDGSWAYANSLNGVKEWLKELQTGVQSGPGEEPVSVITDMLHKERDDRKEAKELWSMIRSDHDRMGDCCGWKPLPPLPGSVESYSSRSNGWLGYPDSPNVDPEAQTGSSESDDGATDYETSRPFKTCILKSREGSTHHIKGDVVIGKTREKDAWTKTRRIKVTPPGTKEKQCMSIFHIEYHGVHNLVIRATSFLRPSEAER
ncbi:kinase-like domain-containing protein [Usnea florida]